MRSSSNRAIALAVLSGIFLLAAVSCKKSNNNSNSGNGSMTATVNGTAWTSNLGTLSFFTESGSEFDIQGGELTSGDTTAFEVFFVGPVKLNQTINSDTAVSGGILINYTDVKSGQSYNGQYGLGHAAITVTSYDSTGHTIGGTFNGILYNINYTNDSVVITNGKFSNHFTAQ